MGKKYKGKLCPYCGTAISTSEEHIFARGFFREADRANLPKAPACRKCNGEKAELEHYAQTVLPFGGRHYAAKENLETIVQRRLQKNQKLFRELNAGRGRAMVVEKPDGLAVPTMTIPIQPAKLLVLAELITKGLAWHHWGLVFGRNTSIIGKFLTNVGDDMMREFVSKTDLHQASNDLGRGTMRYWCCQHKAIPEAMICQIMLLGGVALANEDPSQGVCSKITVVTRPPTLLSPPWPW
jgi:hypothetical protein